MTRPRAPSPSTLFGCLALAGVYFATGLLFRLPALRPISDGLTWPPVGLALAGLLLFGLRLWPGVVAGAFLEHWVAGVPLANSLGSTLGITIETAGAAWLLGRTDFRPSLERVRDVLLLLFIAVLGGLFWARPSTLPPSFSRGVSPGATSWATGWAVSAATASPSWW